MNPLIEIRDLIVSRGHRSVLSVPSLDIQRSEVLALVGPNGAGKSTLILVLAGLLKPQSGMIIFANRPFKGWNALDYRRNISFVFQVPLLLNMTVVENIALGLRFRGVRKDQTQGRVAHWMGKLGITSLANRRAAELSGGEAQRVSLARAFILDTHLLLLDEPFSALDPPSRTKLLEDLEVLLKADQRTVIIVTHNLADAARLSDRVAVIIGGKLRQVAKPGEIKSHPADEEVALFVREMHRQPY